MVHLDTNVVVAYLRGNSRIASLIKQHFPEVAINSIVLAELLYGARVSARPMQNLEKVRQFLLLVEVTDFDQACAEAYSTLMTDLRQRGCLTNEIDALIAATALANNATLVTHNIKHFANIKGLSLKDWLA